jgi:hypothetical protein
MKSPEAPSTQEALAGLVERVTFHNEENGFCVLRTKARGHRDLVTVVGHSATISAGEWITATGEWVNDRNHGQQFKARFLRTCSAEMPTSPPVTTASDLHTCDRPDTASYHMTRHVWRLGTRSICQTDLSRSWRGPTLLKPDQDREHAFELAVEVDFVPRQPLQLFRLESLTNNLLSDLRPILELASLALVRRHHLPL